MSPTGANAIRRVNLVVPADATPEAIQTVSELCCDVVPHWIGLLPSDLTVSVQAGGLSNVLYKVVGPSTSAMGPDGGEETCRVLVRVYGRGTESMVSRDAEVAFMSAFQPVYARFNNGLVYTYIQGEVISTDDLRQPDIMTRIARHMAWHQHTCESVDALHWKTVDASDRSPAQAWANWGPEKMYDLAVEALTERKEGMSDAQWEALSNFDMDGLKQRMNNLRDHIQKYDGHAINHLTLCHNDVFPGNILNTHEYSPAGEATGETGIAFIDFEYSYTNYGFYDLANHFNEWTGLGLNQERFPSEEQAKHFIRAYLTERRRVRDDPTPVTDEEVDFGFMMSMKLSIASNCLWFFWSIAQACNSSIEFDYIDYAQRRLHAWDLHEEKWLAMEPIVVTA